MQLLRKHIIIVFLLIFFFGGCDFVVTEPENESAQVAVTEEQSSTYEVLKIIDGDTIKIDYDGVVETVRLLQIDTPESNHPDSKKNVAMGKVATQFTKDLIGDRRVRLEFDEQLRDKYDRLLCYVYVDDVCVNEELIKAGMAMVLKRKPNIAKYEEYKILEKEARQAKLGIWQDIKASYPKKNIPKEYLK